MFFFTVCRSFKVLKSKKLHEVLDILAEGLVRTKKLLCTIFPHKLSRKWEVMMCFCCSYRQGYPVNQIRPWPLQPRSNGTTRPSLLDIEANFDKTVSSVEMP